MGERAVVFVLGVLLAGLAPGKAAADGEFGRSGPYLGLSGVYAAHWYPSDFDGQVGATTKTENSFGLAVRGGYRVNDWLAGEVGYEWLHGFEQKVAGSRIFELASHAITVNGKLLYPGFGRFQPWALAGIGLSIYEVNDRAGLGSTLESGAVGFVGQFLLGLDAYVTPEWVVTVEGGGVWPTTRISGGSGGDLTDLFYIPIRVGVQYRF